MVNTHLKNRQEHKVSYNLMQMDVVCRMTLDIMKRKQVKQMQGLNGRNGRRKTFAQGS